MLKTLTRILPTGYTELEYIQSSGTQYIDTGYTYTTDTIETCIEMYGRPGTATTIFGTQAGGSTTAFTVVYTSGTACTLFLGSGQVVSASKTFPTDSWNRYTLRTISGTNGSVQLNDTEETNFTYSGGINKNKNVFLFANHVNSGAAQYSSIKCKSFYIIDNNVLVRNFVPVERQSDSAIGMYDTVTKTFFTNSGTGTFTAGPEKSTPAKAMKEIHELYKKSKNLIDIAESTMTASYNFKTLTADEIAKWSNKQLTLSCYVNNIVSEIASCWAMYVNIDGTNYVGNWLNSAGGRTSVSFTIPSTATSVRFLCNRGGSSVTNGHSYNFQLEESPVVTPYEPYGVSYIGEIYKKAPKGHNLPDEYTELEYIEKRNIAGYMIETGVVMTDTDKVTVEANISSTISSGDNYFLSSGNNTWLDLYNNTWYARFGSASSSTAAVQTSDFDQKNTFELSKNNFSINGVQKTTPAFSAVNGQWCIFGQISTRLSPACKLYSCKITDTSTGADRINLIPAKRNSDNVVGMYDKVNGTFKENSGTETFIAGPDIIGVIELPSGYTQLKYVESTTLNSVSFTGTEVWTKRATSGTVGNMYYIPINGSKVTTNNDYAAPCTHFTGQVPNSWYTLSDNCISTHNYDNIKNLFCCRKDDCTDVASFKAWMAAQYANGNPVTVVYALSAESATPNKIYYMKGMSPASHTYVPAKNSSNVAGLYDIDSNTFVTTVSTGTFTAGPEMPKVVEIFSGGWETTVTGTDSVSMTNARVKSTAWKISGESEQELLLPNGYKQLKYLESDGNAYIDTNVSMTGFTIKAEAKFMNIASTLTRYTVFGSWHGAANGFSLDSTSTRYSQTSATVDISSLNKEYVAKLSVDGATVNGTAYTFADTPNAFADTTKKITCFKTNNSANTAPLRIYYFKIWDNDVLVMHLVPAKNSSDVLGMYDTVSKTFFANAGTGTFTAGPELLTPDAPVDVKGIGNSVLPNGYKKLEYIQSSCTQYIDTGIVLTDTTKTFNFEVLGQQINAGVNQYSWWMGQQELSKSCGVYGDITPQYTFYPGGCTYYQNGVQISTPSGGDKYAITKATSTLLGKASATYNWLLFARAATTAGTGGLATNTRIFSFKAWDGNTLIRNFIPAKNSSDVIGMYDTVSNTFFTNSGTGNFIAGPEDTSCTIPVTVNSTDYSIDLSSPLQKIETYTDTIESDGTLTRNVGVVVLDGTESVTAGVSETNYSSWLIAIPADAVKVSVSPLCTHLAGMPAPGMYAHPDSYPNTIVCQGQYNRVIISVSNDIATDETGLKAWLSAQYMAGTPVTVFYPLAASVISSAVVPEITTAKGDNYMEIETVLKPSELKVTYKKRNR